MSNKPGIRFQETMAGGFTMGETDPEIGAKKGKQEGNILAMHANITIDDLPSFIADPEHSGTISGHIDYPELGVDIPSQSGKFNLFSPTEDVKTKYMIYQMGFTVAGNNYYLAGKKQVKDDPGFDIWKDTTTLFAYLHEGQDTNGPVIGAGILSLDVLELMKLVSSMRATNTDSIKDKADALLSFGRFFMGQLWDQYAAKILKD